MLGVRSAASALKDEAPAAASRVARPDLLPVASVTAAASGGLPPVGQAGNGRASLGRAIFFDTNLSQPPGTSCASCHDPARGFAGNNGSRLGVARGSRPNHFAKRNTPSVLYLRFVRKFRLHWEEDAPLVDAYGGFFWDGRTDSLAELSKQPLLNPDEMNGGSARHVADVMASSAYAADFRKEFGSALDDPDAALGALGEAVSAFFS